MQEMTLLFELAPDTSSDMMPLQLRLPEARGDVSRTPAVFITSHLVIRERDANMHTVTKNSNQRSIQRLASQAHVTTYQSASIGERAELT